MNDVKFSEVPADVDLVLELDWDISEAQEEVIRHSLAQKFPGRNVQILPKGVRLRPVVSLQWAARIERKLDQLLQALAEDGQGEEVSDLEGHPMPLERPAGVSLG